ncbi:MAG: putative acyltransferase (DUF342 family) [Arcticibacterium sp.]|jgi:predicted acyltransferase (DUF342 family)
MKTPFKALNVTLCLSLKTLFFISIFCLYGVGLSAQSEIVGSMSIRDSLKIGGSVKIDGSLDIQDSLKIGGSAIIEGILTIQDSLNIGGSADVGGSMYIQDSLDIGGALNISGSTNIDGSLDIQDSLHIGGSVDIMGSLDIGEDFNIGGSMNIQDSLDIGGALDIGGSAKIGGALEIQDSLNVIGSVDISGPANIQNDVGIGGNLDVTGTLNVQTTLNEGPIVLAGPNGELRLTPYYNSGGGTVLIGYVDGKGIGAPQLRLTDDAHDFIDFGMNASGAFVVESVDVPVLMIDGNGNTRIGLNAPQASGYTLSVGGKIAAEEILVDLKAVWPDYVFKSDYKLNSLNEVKNYISSNGHLPGLPAASEVQNVGIELGEMNRVLVEKIEELTLYIIQQEERIKALETKSSFIK